MLGFQYFVDFKSRPAILLSLWISGRQLFAGKPCHQLGDLEIGMKVEMLEKMCHSLGNPTHARFIRGCELLCVKDLGNEAPYSCNYQIQEAVPQVALDAINIHTLGIFNKY